MYHKIVSVIPARFLSYKENKNTAAWEFAAVKMEVSHSGYFPSKVSIERRGGIVHQIMSKEYDIIIKLSIVLYLTDRSSANDYIFFV